MVLLEIDTHRFAGFPLERNAPRPIDVKAVALRLSLQSMKIEAGNPEILKLCGFVQHIQATKGARCKVRPNVPAGA